MNTMHSLAAGAMLAASSLLAQGPLVLMGIDAEDGGVGGHGPISSYESVLTNGNGSGILQNVNNGQSGILVIGGGKSPVDNVTQFYDQIDADLGPGLITYVNGATDISNVAFGSYAALIVVSDQFNTPSGGLTNAENDALTLRSGDIANFVNGGGGLLGFSSCQLTQPYGYLGSIGSFVCASPPQYNDIDPTPAGIDIGITDLLDVCCWHDEYTTFPGFLGVLATNAATGNPAAIGGQQVIIVQGIVVTPLTSQCPINMNHSVTATVADNMGNPVVGTTVTFEILSGPNAGLMGSDTTNAAGQAMFTWTSAALGVDTVEACFIDNNMVQQCATATKEWIPEPECYMFIGLQEGAVPLGPDPDDVMRVLPLVILPVTSTAMGSLAIPNDPNLVGFTVTAQTGMFNPQVYPNNPLQLSNGHRMILGIGSQDFGQWPGIKMGGHLPVPQLGSSYPFWLALDPPQ